MPAKAHAKNQRRSGVSHRRAATAWRLTWSHDPITGDAHQFPLVSLTYMKRNVRAVLNLITESRVVFIAERKRTIGVIFSQETWRVLNERRPDDVQGSYTTDREVRSVCADPSDPPIKPPPGYRSWLDYAVDTFNARLPELELVLDSESPASAVAIRDAARAELKDLRTEWLKLTLQNAFSTGQRSFGDWGPVFQEPWRAAPQCFGPFSTVTPTYPAPQSQEPYVNDRENPIWRGISDASPGHKSHTKRFTRD